MAELAKRVVIADGAMGTMLQAADLTLDDFEQLEGCNEILNVTRPDILEQIHGEYLDTGIDAIETNTFGSNWSNLSDYGIDDRIEELSKAGAEIARRTVEKYEAADGRMRWVLGSIGPGTKLPSLGHTTYAHLKSTFADQARGLILGGSDALLVETSQDLLQTKAAVNGCKQAIVETGIRVPIFVEVTVETTGTMLMGSEIAAALTTLEPLGIDMIGLNCATGPAEMSEHLRHLSKYAHIPVMCMPNAGLPVLGANGASYPLTPDELATAHEQFVKEFGLGLVGGCCGTTPAHLKAVVDRIGGARTLDAHDRGRPGRREPLPARALQPGRVLPRDRRAHERERLARLPRGDARGALGRLRRHRPQPGARGCPPARRVHRLRRTRRCRRHALRGVASRQRFDPARSSSTPPSQRCCRPGWNSSAAARWSTR